MNIKNLGFKTQRELIRELARIVYEGQGYRLPDNIWESKHPTERAVLETAEQVYSLFMGDTPDYSDE